MEKLKKETNGITLVTLMITIIILLILAGIVIVPLTGDNGLLKRANEAKEQTEISEEKEIIDKATIQAMGNNKRGSIVEDELQEQLDKIAGDGKAEVDDVGEEFEVAFIDSKRYYTVDKVGNVTGPQEVAEDPYPGDITKDENGKTLTGDSLEEAYQINCIEDLVALSNMSNGTGVIIEDGEVKTLTEEEKTDFSRKYIILTKNLNFKSRRSYIDSQRTDFGDINGKEDDGNILIQELTTESGFKPIDSFRGTFDGNGKILSNLYEKNDGNACLIKELVNGTVKNLEITGEIICLGDNAGGILSSSYSGNIENCINRINIQATGNNIGGLIGGENGASITNCKNYGNIEGINNVGGITASRGTITNCQNYGTIKGTQTVGGINGQYASITNCQNYGEIGEETNGTQVGGIIGQTGVATVNYCINNGKVKGSSNVGGIGGKLTNGIILVNCINTGEINATNESAGGIGGHVTHINAVINCYNSGEVIGSSRVGGIIGELQYTIDNYNNKIINCYNTGDLQAETYKGGIIGVKRGYGTHYIENCYWKEELNLECGNNIVEGYGILEITNSREYTEKEMKEQAFLQILNNYVETYNQGDKVYSNGNELLTWNFNTETGFPVLIQK